MENKEFYYKQAEYQKKAINENGEDVYTFIFSTNKIDRDEEIVITEGIDFTNYLSNPVVLKSHKSYELPIGKTLRLWIERTAEKTLLLGDIVFGSDNESQEIKAKVDSGVLRAVSIGFKCIEWIYNENSDIRTFTKTELLEVSMVSLPANPDAIRIKQLSNENQIDYDKIGEIVDNKFKSYIDEIETKYGAAISRSNKQRIKDAHDLIDTVSMDLQTVKESLIDIVGTMEEIETDAVNDNPKSVETTEIKKDTNNVDIIHTNKQELYHILKGK